MTISKAIVMTLCLAALSTMMSCVAHSSGQCRLSTTPVTIIDKPGKILAYWDEPNVAEFWLPLKVPSERLLDFRNGIEKVVSSDIETILQKQLPLTKGVEDRENIALVLNRDGGTIRPMNCFESLMFERQLARKPMLVEPTEFLAFVLSKQGMLKIFYLSIDQPGIGNVSEINKIVEQAIDDGYKVDFGLHNHNFFIGKEDIQGAIAPSGSDVQAFRGQLESLGMKKALITNGFDTLVIDEGKFYKFKAVE